MLTKSAFDAFFKEYWVPEHTDRLDYEEHPFLSMIDKDTEAGGEYLVVPIDLDDGPDGGPDFTEAQEIAAANSSLKRQFQFDYVEDFQLTQISNKVLRLSRKEPKLALQKAARERDRSRRILSHRLHRNLWKTGYGEVGRIASTTTLTTKVIVLDDVNDARNFRIGQRLVFASSLTAALRDSGDYVSVTKVDADAGQITVDAPTDLSTSIASIATGDYIFLRKHRGSGASPTPLHVLGVPSWNPDDAPTTGDAFGLTSVDRSVWVNRLAGSRYPAATTASGNRGEVLIRALVHAAKVECGMTHLFVNPDIYGDLMVDLEGRSQKVIEKGMGKLGFAGIEIGVGFGNGALKIIPEPGIKAKRAYGVKLKSWKLHSAGELIQNDLQHGSGLDMASASAVEYRDVFCGAVSCNNTKDNLVIKFT